MGIKSSIEKIEAKKIFWDLLWLCKFRKDSNYKMARSNSSRKIEDKIAIKPIIPILKYEDE